MSWVRLLLVLLLASPAFADEEMRAKALDLVYEAADAIDSAKVEFREGREKDGERLLTRAEEYLKRAEALDPELARIPFERARLQRMDGESALALATLSRALKGELSLGDHIRGVKIVDGIRSDLGQPPLARDWRRQVTFRNVGAAAVAGGMIASAIGFGLAFSSFAEGAYHGVDDVDLFGNRFGWGLSFAGMGIAAAGGVVMLGTTVKIEDLKSVLPGP